MAYLQMISDLGMNYTLNRPLFDGQAKALWDAPVHTAALRWGV